MKRKFVSVLLALVLVLSFSLVMAVPMATPAKAATTLNVYPYTLYSGGSGTSVWSTAQTPTGSASVLLTHTDNTDSVYVDFVPPAGETLATFQVDITAATPAWSFRHFWESGKGPNGPQFELYFDDPDSTGFLEVTAVGLQNSTGTGAWAVETLDTTTLAGYGGWGEDGISGSFFNWGPLTALGGIEAAVNAETNVTNASDWVLTRVRVELWEDIDQYCHIDDITIAGVPYYGLIKDAIDSATAADTISVAAGTYDAETTWPIAINKQLTIQGAAGKTSIISPGSAGQGVIAISADSVTIDGFTITHGTQSYSASNETEHTVWVAAEYSTIKNNTITGAFGNLACLYIGGRTSNTPTNAVYGYQVSEPLGHTIQDNTFRYGTATAGSGEGWGIFAYDLTDSLIHGNTFLGDSDDYTDWNSNEGAPGTGIIIHKATAGTATGSPGGGYVVIEDNTARYMKYSWLTFYAAYHYADSVGYGYEQPEDSEVDKVIVRNNTVQDCGTAIVFSGASKGSAYGVKYADLTVGSNNVTIGQGNTIFNNGDGIRIDAPKFRDPDYGSVVVADTIIIQYNDIYTNTLDASSWWGSPDGYGVRNLTSDLDSGPDTIVAKYNYWGDPSGPTVATATSAPTIAVNDRGAGDALNTYIIYEPWLHTTQATVYPSGVRYYAYNWCDLTKGWNIWSTPIALDAAADTWLEYKELGNDLDLATGSNAYYFTSSGTWASVTDAYQLTPCDALYIKMASDNTSPILFSASTSVPSKTLVVGWNLVSATYIEAVSGIHTGADNAAVLTDGLAAFTPSGLVGKTIYNLTDGSSGAITANTATTITAVEAGGAEDDWDAGDAYGIGIWGEEALASVYNVPGPYNIGYSQVVSPAVNQTAWSAVRGTTIDADIANHAVFTMIPTKGYWVYMTNGGPLAGTVFTPVSPLQ